VVVVVEETSKVGQGIAGLGMLCEAAP
jgi:hypothetical protein